MKKGRKHLVKRKEFIVETLIGTSTETINVEVIDGRVFLSQFDGDKMHEINISTDGLSSIMWEIDVNREWGLGYEESK